MTVKVTKPQVDLREEINRALTLEGLKNQTLQVKNFVSDGNLAVGLDVADPLYDKGIHLYGSNPSLKIEGSSTSAWEFIHFKQPNYERLIGMRTTGSIVINNGTNLDANNHLVVDTGGRVGINTDTPLARFSVHQLNTQFTNGIPTAQIYHYNYPDDNTINVAALDIRSGNEDADLKHHGFMALRQIFTGSGRNSPHFQMHSMANASNDKGIVGMYTKSGNTPTLAIYTDLIGSSESNVDITENEIFNLDGNGLLLLKSTTSSPSLQIDRNDGSGNVARASFNVFGSSTNVQPRLAIGVGAAGSAPSSSVYIGANGNVGIGVSAPAKKLHISDSGLTQIKVSGSSTGYTNASIVLEARDQGRGLGIFYSSVAAGEGYEWYTGLPYAGGSLNAADKWQIRRKASPTDQGNDTADGTILFAVTSAGNVDITGSLSKGSGSFKINHPLPEKKETHHLVHSFVEAPQADNIYRGKIDLVSGRAEVNIDTVAGMTEGTFALLNREIQCFTSNESGWTAVRGSVSGNILTIEAQDNTCTDTVSWLVIGERQDQHMYDTDWTDENGKVIVEPLKDNGQD